MSVSLPACRYVHQALGPYVYLCLSSRGGTTEPDVIYISVAILNECS